MLAAYERIQIRTPELRQEHMLSARREINLQFGEWSNRGGPNLWEIVRLQTTLSPGTATYAITPNVVMILDASIVLNFGTTTESRRYITPISRTEYLSFANQQIQGPPTVYWFDRLESPTITFWPVPDSAGPYILDYFVVTQQQDANLQGGETPDVPYRWLDALVAGLAYRLSRIYAPQMEQQRKMDADMAWNVAAEEDTENVNLSLGFNIGQYYRHR